MDKGVIKIHGKEYQTVAKRIADFRADHPDWSIATQVEKDENGVVVIKAEIRNGGGISSHTIATGYAEEVRDSTNINKTSALENCETSAVGRALAFVGYGGEQIASANEVNGAMIAGAKKEVGDYFVRYNECVRACWDELSAFKEALANDDIVSAFAAWMDIDEDAQMIIYKLAPTKGGALTTKERDIMKSNEWASARAAAFK